jgi:tryptophan 7-halogenase
MKNIVVVGGGTSGWLTALVLNKFHKDCSVTLIESSKFGILGAGEGSVPNFGAMLKLIDINKVDFFNKTKSTIKDGLNFVNWRGDGKSVKHLFSGESNYTNVNNGFHFDAKLVAKYFRDLSIERGVVHIDGIIKSCSKDQSNITSLILDNDDVISTDFIFDCSGFNRLIIGKFYNEEWISYNEYLKVNSAVAYFLPQNDKLSIKDKTQTNMISMKCGWMWQAPLQHRWGCGYVFNDKYISNEDAKKEIEEYVQQEIDIVKTFKYEPGYFKRSWVGNSIAIGLSSTFLEPLESTSLMSSIMQLKRLIDINFDESHMKKFNIFCEEVSLQNMIFVRYHYMCGRDDTPFWEDYKKIKIPMSLSKLVNEDGSLKIKNNLDIYNLLELRECDMSQLTFFYNNYFTIHKTNSIKFEHNII